MSFGWALRFPDRLAAGPGPGAYSPTPNAGGPSYSFGRPRRAGKSRRVLAKVDIENLRLLEGLGHGGLAMVSRTKWQGEEVAAKLWVNRPHLLPGQEVQDREALKAEAAKLNRLSHPNIVKVLAIVQGQGLVAGMLLELLGDSRQARCKTGGCAETRQACSDAAHGLAHMHARLLGEVWLQTHRPGCGLADEQRRCNNFHQTRRYATLVS